MTVDVAALSTASADWLALRAAADDAARSASPAAELAGALAGMIAPGRVVVHDLGAGTGAMTRWLAPRLPSRESSSPQRWVLHDGDAGILSHLHLRDVVDAAGRPVVAEARVAQLADLRPEAFRGASAVTASALLDVLTLAETERIVAACIAAGVPALFSLSVTGTVRLDPREDLDATICAAFNDHQRRDAGGRRLLGPDAVAVLVAQFDAAGWNVRTAPTPWRLGATDGELIAAWLDGWVGAAVEQRPELAAAAAPYRDRRLAQVTAGNLQVTVAHEDVLAWPR